MYASFAEDAKFQDAKSNRHFNTTSSHCSKPSGQPREQLATREEHAASKQKEARA
jgi:hypothetical protein